MSEQNLIEVYEAASPQAKSTNLMEIAKAEIDTQIATARQYPRSIKQFMNTALAMVTLNESVANSCNYGLPRGGKIITGASVRFAEIIFSAWGNARAGTRIISDDGRFITAQGVCHDLQSNTMITKEIKRKITDKNGKTFNEDMITVTGNAASSIALRNAILSVIPKAFWETLYEESRKVAMGDSKTLSTRRADALAVMQKFGVTLEMILEKFEIKGVEDITLEHLQILNACRNSIKAGETTPEALFAVPVKVEPKAGNEGLKTALKKKAEKSGANPETGELEEKKEPEAQSENVPEYNTKLIPVGFVDGDASKSDFEGWKLAFMKACNSAPSLALLSEFYTNNVKILNQVKTRAPVFYEECERTYQDNCARLAQ